ncbi:GNAT family N-acetyltransferase [Conexibacter sp. DBS9H8]|uniref:GNAT family N-acetyltransferase n=1 Tax=Conexibacter sp. DBS9H8 TaxID=2937801 RepID=UPI002010BE46|nr:GNAT family N-acetyltransferase [Conexibacter sp. DBS9H8]
MTAGYDSVALSTEHDVARFDCGIPGLNAWLADQALRAQRAGTARTFVWVTADSPEQVWAYFSLAPTEVARDVLTRGQSSGYSTVPGYLLARLALHADLRGRGYGGQLLVDALSRAAKAAEVGGGRLVVVDTLDETAASFYRHYDFTPVRGDPRRLVLKIATVRKLLG